MNMVVAGLKFSKTEIGEAGNDEKNTLPAVILISISVLFNTIVAYFMGNGGSGGFGNSGYTGFNAAIAALGSDLIGTLLSALILSLVLRIFKVKPTFIGTFRVYGAVIIWSIIGGIVGLFLPESLSMLSIAFWLAFNVALMFGLMGFTDVKWWQAFLSIAITFAVTFLVSMLYGVILGLIIG